MHVHAIGSRQTSVYSQANSASTYEQMKACPVYIECIGRVGWRVPAVATESWGSNLHISVRSFVEFDKTKKLG